MTKLSYDMTKMSDEMTKMSGNMTKMSGNMTKHVWQHRKISDNTTKNLIFF